MSLSPLIYIYPRLLSEWLVVWNLFSLISNHLVMTQLWETTVSQHCSMETECLMRECLSPCLCRVHSQHCERCLGGCGRGSLVRFTAGNTARSCFQLSDLGQVVSLLCICLSTFQMPVWAVRIEWDMTGAAALGEKPSAVHTCSGLQLLFLT